MKCEVSIVGGGLSGMLAAVRLSQLGIKCLLVDYGLPQAKGKTGGFAKFSGAKFSLPPAGMGLLNVVRYEQQLWEVIDRVSDFLGLDFSSLEESIESSDTLTNLRSYRSLVLMPDEIDEILHTLSVQLCKLGVTILKGDCNKIVTMDDHIILNISTNDGMASVSSKALFYAGGRLGNNSLSNFGVNPTNRKGLDVGARIDFSDQASVSGLRSHGPDAKIIKDRCRTFCLNVPGRIFRYPFNGISIPGGIVSESIQHGANFGMLYRSDEKTNLLSHILDIGSKLPVEDLERNHIARGSVFGDAQEIMRQIYGDKIYKALEEFGEFLGEMGLVDWEQEHYVHIPLIDWHWDTYSLNNTFETSHKGIYCIGDSSGHARGLLQAAVSGWVAAEEYANGS